KEETEQREHEQNIKKLEASQVELKPLFGPSKKNTSEPTKISFFGSWKSQINSQELVKVMKNFDPTTASQLETLSKIDKSTEKEQKKPLKKTTKKDTYHANTQSDTEEDFIDDEEIGESESLFKKKSNGKKTSLTSSGSKMIPSSSSKNLKPAENS